MRECGTTTLEPLARTSPSAAHRVTDNGSPAATIATYEYDGLNHQIREVVKGAPDVVHDYFFNDRGKVVKVMGVPRYQTTNVRVIFWSWDPAAKQWFREEHTKYVGYRQEWYGWRTVENNTVKREPA